jgi:hypothetical protein
MEVRTACAADLAPVMLWPPKALSPLADYCEPFRALPRAENHLTVVIHSPTPSSAFEQKHAA